MASSTLPVRAVAVILEVPETRQAEFKKWADSSVAAIGRTITDDERKLLDELSRLAASTNPFVRGGELERMWESVEALVCAERLAVGKLPACVEACPVEAIVLAHHPEAAFTDRRDAVIEISVLRENRNGDSAGDRPSPTRGRP